MELDADDKGESQGQIVITVEDTQNIGRSAKRTFAVDALALPSGLVAVPAPSPNELCLAVLKKLTLFYSKEKDIMMLGTRS